LVDGIWQGNRVAAPISILFARDSIYSGRAWFSSLL
jgi:hypothetical protein